MSNKPGLRHIAGFVLVLIVAGLVYSNGNPLLEDLNANPSGSLKKVVCQIDWQNGMIKMRGQGAPPLNTQNLAQARLMAERAAKLDALRNFLEMINGVRVTSETLVQNLVTKSDVIKTKMEGFVKDFATQKVGYLSDGSVYVDMLFPLYGPNGLAEALLPEVISQSPTTTPAGCAEQESMIAKLKKEIADLRAQVAVLEAKLAGTEPPTTVVETPPAVTGGPYTGLIVDASGTGLQPCLAPKVVSENGESLYTGSHADPDTAIEKGVVGYGATLDETKKLTSRVGNNPLVIKAVSVRGPFKADAVISDSDAAMIKSAGLGKAFSSCGVAMVIGK